MEAGRERAKVLMLVYSPEKNTSSYVTTGTNLIDIECSFKENRSEEQAEEQAEFEDAEEEHDDLDDSMQRLLHGNARGRQQQ